MRVIIFINDVGRECPGTNEHVVGTPLQLFGYYRLNIEYARGFNQGKYAIGIYFGKTGYSARKIHGQYGYYSEQSVSVDFFSNKWIRAIYGMAER